MRLGVLLTQVNLQIWLSYRDREERLAALTAAQQEAMEELQKKIQLKVRTACYFNLKFQSLQWSTLQNSVE